MATFLSRPLLDLRPNFTTPQEGFVTDAGAKAVGFGVTTSWVNQEWTQRRFRMEFLLQSKAEIRAMEALIDGVRGRLQGFWIPSHADDLRLTRSVTATDTELQFEDAGLRDNFGQHPGWGYAALVDTNAITPVRIQAVAQDSDKEKATLTAVVGRAFTMAETKCCWLSYVRLVKDDVDFEYITDTTARVKLEVIELPEEYSAQELGTRPVYLYELTQGSALWRWTSYGADLTAGAVDWKREDITHGQVTSSTEFLDEGVRLQIGLRTLDNPFRAFIAGAPVEPMSVKIYVTLAPGFTVDFNSPLYAGDVRTVGFKARGLAEVELSSILRINDWTVPRVQVQRLCNWTLFDPITCRLNGVLFETSGTLTAVTETYVEATAFGAKATAESDANWFASGRLKVGDEARLVLSQAGNRLYINAPFRKAIAGSTAIARPGCDKKRGTCTTKYNNLVNRGGFDYIPLKNPQLDALNPPDSNSGSKK